LRPNTELKHVFAVLAYAEALRTMDGPRLERAFQLVSDLVPSGNLSNDPGLEEIQKLIPSHPAYPAL
jgi:hypothetical protein